MNCTFRPGVALALLSLAASRAPADDASLAPAALAAGFAKLEQLGAPNVAKAVYVKLESGAAAPLLPYTYETRGNAWMLTEIRGTNGCPLKATFVTADAATIEVGYSDDRWQNRESGTTHARIFGTWRPANLERDTRAVLSFLNDMHDESASSGVYLGSDTRAALFLFAMHLFQRGDTNNASRIVTELFRHVQDRRVVILEALNRLADTQYGQVYRDFQASHDWTAYRSGITNLMTRYPRGWKERPALELLVERINQRLSGTPQAPITTNELSQADLELATRFLNLRSVQAKPEYESAEAIWLLPTTWTNRYPVADNADLAARARGVAGLPFLVALANDGALTEADAEPFRSRNYTRRTPDSDAEDKALAWFNCIPRPATRGEAALAILADILPDSLLHDSSWSQTKPEPLLETAKALHTEFSDRPEEQLAVRFLRENSRTFDEPILTLLLPIAIQRRVPAFETYIASDFAEDHAQYSFMSEPDQVAKRRTSLLTRYAALRGAEVQPLVTQLVARIEYEAAHYKKPDNVSYGSDEANAKHEAEMTRKLHEVATRLTAVRFETPTDALLDAALQSGDSNDLLAARLRALPLEDAVGLLLDKAVLTNAPAARLKAAGQIATVRREDATKGMKLNPVAHAAAWRDLIADERHITNTVTSVADTFLCLNEALFSPTNTLPPEADGPRWRHSDDYYDYDLQRRSVGCLAARTIATYGVDGRTLVRARVLARLTGTPEADLPKYPHQAPPTKAEAARLRNRFAAVANREEAARLVSEQPLPIKAALTDILCADPALNARLTALAATVTNIAVTDDPMRGVLAPWLNHPVDPALVQTLSEYCLRQGSNQVAVLCQIDRQSDFGGCSVTVKAAPPDLMAEGINDSGQTNQLTHVVGVTGLVCAHGVLGAARWRFSEQPEKRGWGTFTASEPATYQHMDQAIADFCGSKADATSAGIVRFLAKGPGL